MGAISVLHGLELNVVHEGHLIETITVNEELEATSHGDLPKGARGGLVSVTQAL